jgi:micrococcal nuclease
MRVGGALAIVVMACGCRGTSTGGEAGAIVERIVDGDTIDVTIEGRTERIRLIGIDTPEIAHPSSGDRPGNDAECFGDEASAFTASLVPVGTPVRLERDVVGRDDYGRVLAYVHRASDGLFVNHEIVRRGYARPLTIAPNVTHHELMVEAARDAEQSGAGLWSSCR